jgi:hypothetical protein
MQRLCIQDAYRLYNIGPNPDGSIPRRVLVACRAAGACVHIAPSAET